MKKFELKTKCGEVINRITTTNINNAVVTFAKIKNLNIDLLLSLFIVCEV